MDGIDYENLRNAIFEDIAWYADIPDWQKNNIGAWTSAASRIARYMNTLIVLNNYQLKSSSLKSINVNELEKIMSKVSMEFQDVTLFKRKIKEIKTTAQGNTNYMNKTQQLHTITTQLIQGLQKYVKV